MAERKTYTAEDFKGCNGRRVLVEAVITDGRPEAERSVVLKFSDGYKAVVPHAAIVEILPEEIKVGDKVRYGPTGYEAHVEHIITPKAWIAWGDGGDSVVPLSDLTLVERAG